MSSSEKPIHSPEAEMCFLASLVVDNSAIQEASKTVSRDSIWVEEHRNIYDEILRGAPCDLVILKDRLALSGHPVNNEKLYSIVETLPSAAHWPDYAASINDHARRRRIVSISHAIAQKTIANAPLNGEIDDLKSAISFTPASRIPESTPASKLLSMEIPELDYIINPLASAGNLCLLQGEPKGGKSCFALLSAIAASSAQWPFGRWEPPKEKKRVLFITYEDGMRLLRDRILQYTLGMTDSFSTPPDISTLSIYARENAPRMRLDSPDGVSMLRSVIESHSSQFVVIDTLSHLSNGDENSKMEMQPVMDALSDASRDFNCSIMVIHHAGKPSDKNPKSTVYRGRGSTSIPAAFHSILDWGKNSGNITECKFIDKEGNRDEFVVEYLPEADNSIVRWKLSDPEASGEDRYANRRAILEALSAIVEKKPEGATRADVSKESKLSKNTVITHLETLVNEGSIQHRRFQRKSGGEPVWVYAPITHQFPTL